MGADSRLHGTVEPLLRQYAPILCQRHAVAVPQWDKLSQPVCNRAPAVGLYRAIHLSAAEPGRTQILDPRIAAVAARAFALGQVRILGNRRSAHRRVLGLVERLD